MILDITICDFQFIGQHLTLTYDISQYIFMYLCNTIAGGVLVRVGAIHESPAIFRAIGTSAGASL